MGEQDVADPADSTELRAFVRALLDDLRTLEAMIETGRIESGVRRIGAEQEVFLVDEHWQPAPLAGAVLARLAASEGRATGTLPGGFTTELGRFNLEINADPQELHGDCLAALEADVRRRLDALVQATRAEGGEAVLCGILPTLDRSHLSLDWMSPNPRYHQLNQVMRGLRGADFTTRIKGLDELHVAHDNVMLEACNTSFQIHFQVGAEEFASLYNLAQAVTGPVLAAAVNSPVLLQHRLWHETRIALFQQSLDVRTSSQEGRSQRTRVSFGEAWIQDSVLEIFREDIARFRVLLSTRLGEPSSEVLARGEIPTLDALRLHNGTVYRWNRPCYGIGGGVPHLRIENRVLPAGPTLLDEMANAAFFFGVMCGYSDELEDVSKHMAFDDAKDNFNAAARYGLKCEMRWFGGQEFKARDLILEELLPRAKRGLEARDVPDEHIERYLGVIEARVASGRTGARWALDSLSAMDSWSSPDERHRALTAAMVANQKRSAPVHTWELACVADTGDWRNSYRTVRQVMSKELFTVHPEDLVDLAASVMEWEHIRHVPVEDDDGALVGLVSHRALLRLVGRAGAVRDRQLAVREIMASAPHTTGPDTSTLDAMQLMREKRVSCLPVVECGKLVGIVTESDFIEVAAKLLENELRRDR